MVLESTIVCVDNSEFMRNGDFIPTRLQAQQDAVSLVCHSKTRSNPENNVGLLTLSNSPEVLATLTTDVGRILSKLHQVQPIGNINFLSGIRIAHLALKHRQGKNHKMRIIVFIGSPIEGDEKEIVKLAKRLKKEKVNVDIVNFGEDALNTDKLTAFVNTINGKEGSGQVVLIYEIANVLEISIFQVNIWHCRSHLVTVPPGPHLSDALISSPVIQGEDGSGAIGIGTSGFEFGVDPNEDPELALALRVSMEEQRQRQEEDARRAAAQSVAESTPQASGTQEGGSAEEALLEKALAMSLEADKMKDEASTNEKAKPTPNIATMSEEEQIAYAMQMSLQQSHEGSSKASQSPTPMETDEGKEEDYTEVMNDPEFLQSVLENLPGVDPQSEAVRQAMGSLTDKNKKDKDKKPEKK